MKIPDQYDEVSTYIKIIDSGTLVGTYRLIFEHSPLGMPIEDVGFQLDQFQSDTVCGMSRLVVCKEKRGKINFRHIISSASQIAKDQEASVLLVEILPQNFHLFKRQGFVQVGEPLKDKSVQTHGNKESLCIPMKKYLT